MVHSKWTLSMIGLVIFGALTIFLLGFSNRKAAYPYTVYKVFVDGEAIGTVTSVDDFNEYVNEKENAIREKYGVNKVYMPASVDIKKYVTYDSSVDSNEKVYNQLIADNSFTIEGNFHNHISP